MIVTHEHEDKGVLFQVIELPKSEYSLDCINKVVHVPNASLGKYVLGSTRPHYSPSLSLAREAKQYKIAVKSKYKF